MRDMLTVFRTRARAGIIYVCMGYVRSCFWVRLDVYRRGLSVLGGG